MNHQKPILLVTILLLLTCLSYTYRTRKVPTEQIAVAPRLEIKVDPVPEPLPAPPAVVVVEPTWTVYGEIKGRQAGLGEVLADIEAHMPAGHIYKDNDRVTWAHETSHGIASHLRQKFGGMGRVNGFYCLQNRAAIIPEPSTTIQRAAGAVPRGLRGGVYQLYMIQQAASWGDTPLYVCDEWMGYTNGTHAGIDLAERGEWSYGQRLGTVKYMVEFNVYTISMLSTIPQGPDEQLKKFVMWNLERSLMLLEKSKTQSAFSDASAVAYWEEFQKGAESEALRNYSRGLFGVEWCQRVLGF